MWDQETRARVQLQERDNNIFSLTNAKYGLTYLEVAMLVMTVHANSCELFHSRGDRQRYEDATKRLIETLYRANKGRHQGGAGNRYREQFRARLSGQSCQFRIDVEIVGPLAVSA